MVYHYNKTGRWLSTFRYHISVSHLIKCYAIQTELQIHLSFCYAMQIEACGVGTIHPFISVI